MLKNITVSLKEDVALWARKEAAAKNTSVSKLLGAMLEERMRSEDSYWEAYEAWKKLRPIKGVDASKRLKRDELYERR